MAMGPLLLESDNNVGVTGVSDESDGTFLNTGTMTYAVYALDDIVTPITNGSCTYVAASNGNYLGIIDASVMTTTNFTCGGTYLLKFTFVQGNYNRVWRDQVLVTYGE